jgi:hypothetical protein
MPINILNSNSQTLNLADDACLHVRDQVGDALRKEDKPLSSHTEVQEIRLRYRRKTDRLIGRYQLNVKLPGFGSEP